VKKSELRKIIKEELLKEMPYGKGGYFPPMGAPSPRQPNPEREGIFTGNTAETIAKQLKKVIDKANKDLKVIDKMIAPFVNYYPDTQQGYLILGYIKTDLPTHDFNKSDWKLERKIFDKYDPILKKILSSAKTRIWSDYHKGISGQYKGIKYKSGIVRSIVTPGKQFSDNTAKKLKSILEK